MNAPGNGSGCPVSGHPLPPMEPFETLPTAPSQISPFRALQEWSFMVHLSATKVYSMASRLVFSEVSALPRDTLNFIGCVAEVLQQWAEKKQPGMLRAGARRHSAYYAI